VLLDRAPPGAERQLVRVITIGLAAPATRNCVISKALVLGGVIFVLMVHSRASRRIVLAL
jgi:hypothetical protein